VIEIAEGAVLSVLFKHAVPMPAESDILSVKIFRGVILIVVMDANRLKLELACLSQLGAQLSKRLLTTSINVNQLL